MNMPSTTVLAGLAVAIFIAAYLAYSSLSPGPAESGRAYCLLHAGYSCAAYQFDSRGGILIDLAQTTGSPITVTEMGCAEYTQPSFFDRLLGARQVVPEVALAPLTKPIPIEDRSHAVVTGNSSGNAAPLCCATGSGAECKARIAFRIASSNGAGPQNIVGDVAGHLR